MDTDSHSQNSGSYRGRFYVRVIAVFCSFSLVLISLMLVGVNTHATTIVAQVSPVTTITPIITITIFPSPSPSPSLSPSPSPSPTATPSPTPTATKQPSPTPTATTVKPTPTPKAGATPNSSVPTATPMPGATPTARITPAVVHGQTPTATALTGNPTTTTNSGGGPNAPTTPPPTAPTSSGLTLPKVLIGLLLVLGLISAIMIVLVVMRNRLLPAMVPNSNLPPSGAKPWQRWRAGSLNGITNNQGVLYSAATMQNAPTQIPASGMPPSMNPMFANNNGFPPPQQWDNTANANGFPPPPRSNSANDNGFPPPPRWDNTANANGFPPPPRWDNSS